MARGQADSDQAQGMWSGRWDLSERWWYPVFDLMLLGTDFFSSVLYTGVIRTKSQCPPQKGLAMTYRDATSFCPWWQKQCCFSTVEFLFHLGISFGWNQDVTPISDCPVTWPLNTRQQLPLLYGQGDVRQWERAAPAAPAARCHGPALLMH